MAVPLNRNSCKKNVNNAQRTRQSDNTDDTLDCNKIQHSETNTDVDVSLPVAAVFHTKHQSSEECLPEHV